MTTPDYQTRINKLDSFFLWIASLSGVGFSIFISFLQVPVLTYFPIFVLIAIGVAIGYLNGAVFQDSFANRMRGWSYLLIGLAIYVPFAGLKFSEIYLTQKFPGYTNWEPVFSTISGMVFVVAYFICVIKVTPRMYDSFGLGYGVVTKRILNRTAIASVILGFTLYIFVSAINFSSDLLTFAIFLILMLSFATPITVQERRVKKLLPLEKFQDCISIEILEKKIYYYTFIGLFFALSLLLLIVSKLPQSEFQGIVVLILLIFYITSILGVFFSLIFSDRGDMVRIKEKFERKLTATENDELNRVVNFVNS
jgi:hypothetical protein